LVVAPSLEGLELAPVNRPVRPRGPPLAR